MPPQTRLPLRKPIMSLSTKRLNGYTTNGIELETTWSPVDLLFPQKLCLVEGRRVHPLPEEENAPTPPSNSPVYQNDAKVGFSSNKNRERVGIQIRVFNFQESPLDLVAEQVINCTLTQRLLPGVDTGAGAVDVDADRNRLTKAVLVTSLYPQSFDRIKNMYWEHPAAGGTIISVHQPSHEEAQLTGRERHDLKVLAEMYLLSYADVLVTSAWSTFGYAVQGLAGVRPWILVPPHGAKMPQPACVRDVSMDPCCHKPPWYDCKECKSFTDPGKEVPYATHCMDVENGIKIVVARNNL